MKIKRFSFLAILAIALQINTFAQLQSEPDRAELLALFKKETQRWIQAYNSGDGRNLIPLYADDAIYVSSHVPGLVADGRDRLIANFEKGMKTGGHIDSIEILRMDVSCNLASLLCQYHATNNGVSVTGRNLLVLEKVNDRWIIIRHMTVV